MQVMIGETKCARENPAFHTERSVDDWDHVKHGLRILIAVAALLLIAVTV
jgi:hypothetical protein